MTASPQTPRPDSLRAVVRDVVAAPEYEWGETPEPLSLLQDLIRRIADWGDVLLETHPVAYWALIGLLTLILLGLLAHLGYVLWSALRPSRLEPRGPRVPRTEVRDAAWHRAEYRRLRGEGRAVEALGHLFVGLVLDLDRRRLVTYHPSKTPAEYVRDDRLDPDARGALAELVGALYHHMFGGAPCTGDDLDRFERTATALGGHRANG